LGANGSDYRSVLRSENGGFAMRALRRFLHRVVNVATRRAQDERLREEIEEHIALQTAENLRAGLSPVEARRQAMLKFGGVEAMKQDYRAERGLLFIENLLGDLRNAGRTIRRMPGLAAVIVVSLAIGIGVNTTIFSWIQMILFQPLPCVSGASNFLLVEPRTETGGIQALPGWNFAPCRRKCRHCGTSWHFRWCRSTWERRARLSGRSGNSSQAIIFLRWG
jgi:hypothetical protein